MIVDHKVRLQHQVAEAADARDGPQRLADAAQRPVVALPPPRGVARLHHGCYAQAPIALCKATDPCVRAYIQVASARFIHSGLQRGRRLSAFCCFLLLFWLAWLALLVCYCR